MQKKDINFDALKNAGMEFVDKAVLDTMQENVFQGFSLNLGQVVIFPEDEIPVARLAIRNRPIKADYEAFERAMEVKEELLRKKDNGPLSEEEAALLEKYESWTEAKHAIPMAMYLIGADVATGQPVPVLVSYLNRSGRRTADGKMESVDQLSAFLFKNDNAGKRAEALRGRTIIVDDSTHKWFMRKFGKDEYAEKAIITISIKDEDTCKVEQPNA